jgi:hypothetical protein
MALQFNTTAPRLRSQQHKNAAVRNTRLNFIIRIPSPRAALPALEIFSSSALLTTVHKVSGIFLQLIRSPANFIF